MTTNDVLLCWTIIARRDRVTHVLENLNENFVGNTLLRRVPFFALSVKGPRKILSEALQALYDGFQGEIWTQAK